MSWKIMLGLFLLIVIVIIGSCIFDYFRFVIVDYTIKSNKVNKTLSIVVITDLHNKQFGHENRSEERRVGKEC